VFVNLPTSQQTKQCRYTLKHLYKYIHGQIFTFSQ